MPLAWSPSSVSVVEQRPGARIGDPPTGLVLVEGALERPQQQVALGAVGIDDAEARVRFTVRRLYRLADLGDIGGLAAKDEKLPGLNFGLEEAGIFDERLVVRSPLSRSL